MFNTFQYPIEHGRRSIRPSPEEALGAVHPGWALTHSHMFACLRAVGIQVSRVSFQKVQSTQRYSWQDVAGYQRFLLESSEEPRHIPPLYVPQATRAFQLRHATCRMFLIIDNRMPCDF